MTPGPTMIIACPHCRGLAAYGTLNSSNSFGTRWWSDGKMIAPMRPEVPAFVKCRHCLGYYWLEDAAEVGELPVGYHIGTSDPSWAEAELVEEPTEDEYYGAIAEELWKDREQEQYLRMLAWHRGNDPFRVDGDEEPRARAGVSEAFANNLRSLVSLLDQKDEDKVMMKAEALRELGRFAEAIDTLACVLSPDYAQVVQQLRTFCERGDAGLKELRFED